jgi:hypothetical protein
VRRVVAALTFPGEAVGEVVANLRISDDFVVSDTDKALKEAGAATEPRMREVGDEWGRTTSESFSRRVSHEGPRIADELEKGLRRRKINLPDIDGEEGGRRWLRSMGTGLLGAIAGKEGGGIFNKISTTISDAIGAGFNVSGRSPLITLILPVIGAIVALVLAAVHGLHALIALLYSIPNILFAIGIQAGVLFLIFHNVGTAISEAFAAKNVTELNAALKDLNPSLAQFIRTLLPVKQIFKDLSDTAQKGFFSAFDAGGVNPITNIFKQLKSLPSVVSNVSFQLGTTFKQILDFFATPEFNTFFEKMGDSTRRFLRGFGPAITELLTGLTSFGIALTPFADKVGKGFNEMLTNIGKWLTRLSNDEDFLKWLDQAFGVLDKLFDLGFAIVQFFMTLSQVLQETGSGDQLLIQLKEFIQILSFLMQTEGGKKAIEGLVHAALLLTAAFVGLVIVVGFVFAALESFFEWFRYDALPWLAENLPKVGAIFLTLLNQVFQTIGDIFTLFPRLLIWIGTKIAEGLKWLWDKVVGFFSDIPRNLTRMASDWGGILVQAGKNIIQGLLNGMKDTPVGNVVSGIVSKIASFFPHSPAKEGPMSGQGDPYYSGQAIVERLGQGMQSQVPTMGTMTADVMNSINNAVRMVGPAPAAATPTAPAADQPQVFNIAVQVGDKTITDMVDVQVTKVVRLLSQQLAYGTRSV